MKWLRSAADFAVDLITSVALSVATLIDDWRER